MRYEVDSGNLQIIMDGVEIEAIVGESARIDVPEAINYIKTGQAEIDQAVQEGLTEFNNNATEKTNDFNDNASTKTTDFNTNAANKTSSFNNNYTEKLNDFNSNASDKTNDFNDNASDKTSSFNDNYTDKLNDFNSNATDKKTDFNDNYIAKKEIIDEKAEEASGYADTAKQWAVGEPTEPTGGSAKHWAQEAESSLSGLSSRVSDIEGLIPNTASPSNQLTDENFVNSSIATNTANFIGTFANVTALNAYSGTVTNNDYAFVTNSVVTDNGNDWATFNDLNAYDKSLLTDFDYAWVINGANFDLYRFDIVNQVWVQRATNIQKSSVTLNSAFNRYKATVNGSTTWNYEYTLNNSSFTAAQWAAINSGITGEKVALITPFTGADGTNAGTTGLVTAPSATDNGKFLKGDGTWGLPTASTAWGNITGTLSNQTDLQNALNAKADDSAVVKLTGNQNIDGSKTLLKQLQFKQGGTYSTAPASSQIYGDQFFRDSTDKLTGRIDNFTTTDGTTHIRLIAYLPTDTSKYSVIEASVDKNGYWSTYVPTPAIADNSSKIANTAFVVNVLKTIYPVGAVYIGTTSTCPLASFFGTWTLKSTGIVTSVDANVQVKGNRKAIGIMGNKSDGTVVSAALGLTSVSGVSAYPVVASDYIIDNNPTVPSAYAGAKDRTALYLSDDATKSGIVGTASSSKYVVNIWERTA